MNIIFPFVYFMSWIAFFGKNKYYQNFFEITLLLLLWILISFPGQIADTIIYQSWFDRSSTYTPLELIFQPTEHIRDIGYVFINSLCYYLGMNFEQFRFSFGTTFIVVLTIFLRKCTKRLLIVFLLYTLWSFLIDVIQMRTAAVHLLIFLAIYFFSKNNNQYRIISLVLFFIAASMHLLGGIYLPFLIFYRFYKNKWVVITIIVLSFLEPIYMNFIGNSLSSIINAYVYSAASESLSHFAVYDITIGRLANSMYWLAANGMAVELFLLKRYYSNKFKNNIQRADYINYFEVCYAFSLYLLLFLPIYGLSGAEFARIPRCFMLSFITAVAIFLQNIDDIKMKIKIIVPTITILMLFGIFSFYLNPQEIILAIFTENTFFSE